MTTESPSPIDEDHPREVELPLPPRKLTPRGRRRSWNERPVRIWMILGVLVLLATAWVATRDISEALYERYLIFHGEVVRAKVVSVDGYDRPDRAFARTTPQHVKLRYTLKDDATSTPLETEMDLPQLKSGMISAGDTIEMRVDPKIPTNVTIQTVPSDWVSQLTVASLLVAGLTLVILMMLWQQRRVVRAWREGESVEGVVVDFKHASIAPRSRLVRFTLADGDDSRVFAILWPLKAGHLEPGDSIDLVALNGNGNRAVVAELYV